MPSGEKNREAGWLKDIPKMRRDDRRQKYCGVLRPGESIGSASGGGRFHTSQMGQEDARHIDPGHSRSSGKKIRGKPRAIHPTDAGIIQTNGWNTGSELESLCITDVDLVDPALDTWKKAQRELRNVRSELVLDQNYCEPWTPEVVFNSELNVAKFLNAKTESIPMEWLVDIPKVDDPRDFFMDVDKAISGTG